MIFYLTIEEVVTIHDELLHRYGGLAGVRDINLLLFAVDAPKASLYGQEMYPTIYDKASAYLFHLVSNHPFNDANKRTGFTSVLVFLEINDIIKVFKKEELQDVTLEVAKGTLNKE